MVVKEECAAVWKTMDAHATDAFFMVLINVIGRLMLHSLEGSAI